MEINFLVTRGSDWEIPMGSQMYSRPTFVGVICCIDKREIMQIDILAFQKKKLCLDCVLYAPAFQLKGQSCEIWNYKSFLESEYQDCSFVLKSEFPCFI